ALFGDLRNFVHVIRFLQGLLETFEIDFSGRWVRFERGGDSLASGFVEIRLFEMRFGLVDRVGFTSYRVTHVYPLVLAVEDDESDSLLVHALGAREISRPQIDSVLFNDQNAVRTRGDCFNAQALVKLPNPSILVIRVGRN